jgi:CheY-like chemotaxis protein
VKTHSAKSQRAHVSPPRPACRILVADDEAFIVTTVAHKLRERGYEVVTAADGEQARALACESKFDLVLSDFQMPLLSGYDLCVLLRQEPRTAELPVIMLTARGHRLSASQLAQTNIKHLLPKPFSAKDLINKVEEIIGPAPTLKVA